MPCNIPTFLGYFNRMLPPYLVPLAAVLAPVLAGGYPEFGANIPPKVAPEKLDNFTWTNPFVNKKIDQFDAACGNARTFSASEFQLHDLSTPEPAGLEPYSEALKTIFGGRPYPGGWNGIDAHGYERNLLKMEYKDVPLSVREWIEAQEEDDGPGKGLFAVFDKPEQGDTVKQTADLSRNPRLADEKRTVVFAPGAVYENLPLWVAEDSGCEGMFAETGPSSKSDPGADRTCADSLADLSKYGPELVDGGVVGWPTQFTKPARKEGRRQMRFTLKAQVLSAQTDATTSEGKEDPAKVEVKDEL